MAPSCTDAPDAFPSAPLDARGLPGARYSLQVYVEDCTGCALCVEACPATSPSEPGRKAINLAPRAPLLAREREKQLLKLAMQAESSAPWQSAVARS